MIPPAPWEIRHLDLSLGCSPIECTSANAVRLFIRIDGVVLAAINLLASDLPMSAAETASLIAEKSSVTISELLAYGSAGEAQAWPTSVEFRPGLPLMSLSCVGDNLARLRDLIATRRQRAAVASVSIVICTRYRSNHLLECLRGCAPELANGREIIVVDNGPDEATQAVVASFPGVRYLVETMPGLSRARNAGVRAATGSIIVFTDDDVRPERGWVDDLLVGFCDAETAMTTGLVIPAELQSDAQISFEFGLGFGGMGFVPLRFDTLAFLGRKSYGAPVDQIGAGANMAIRREIIARLGYFDERIGPGALGGCADDSEFWYRVLSAGYTARYEPFSVVRHVHRDDMASLQRLAESYFYGAMAGLFAQFRKHRHWGNLRRILYYLPKYFLFQFAKNSLRYWRGEFDFLFWPKIRGYIKGFRAASLLLK